MNGSSVCSLREQMKGFTNSTRMKNSYHSPSIFLISYISPNVSGSDKIRSWLINQLYYCLLFGTKGWWPLSQKPSRQNATLLCNGHQNGGGSTKVCIFKVRTGMSRSWICNTYHMMCDVLYIICLFLWIWIFVQRKIVLYLYCISLIYFD